MNDNATKYGGWIAAAAVVMIAWSGHESGPTLPTATGMVFYGNSNSGYVYRVWSSGRVDRTWTDVFCHPNPGCGFPVTIISDTVCTGDVDLNGAVGSSDLLEVVAGWGECARGESSLPIVMMGARPRRPCPT